MISPKRVNSKEQQASAGNWGHPSKFEKKMTKVIEYPHKLPSRKRKKKRRTILWFGEACPFCGGARKELPKKERGIFTRYAPKCSCGAKEVKQSCPACKTTGHIWRRGNEYTHEFLGCGFKGERKDVEED